MFEYIRIGKVLKAYKNSGELLALIDTVFFNDLKACKAIFLRIDGLEVPFFIQSLDLDEENSIVKLEEFSSPEDVKAFNGKDILLRTIDTKVQSEGSGDIQDLDSFNGFLIVDENQDIRLEILKVEQFPEQLMAQVSYGEAVKMIPLVEEMIIEIDQEKRVIHMQLPEGLLEL